MRLQDAWALCQAGQAKLIVRDEADPLCWGSATRDGFGTLWMWTLGHTVPMLICQYTDEKPDEADQEECVCGEKHGFPSMRDEEGHLTEDGYKLWAMLSSDERWEPVFAMTVLDAMVHEPKEQEDQGQ